MREIVGVLWPTSGAHSPLAAGKRWHRPLRWPVRPHLANRISCRKSGKGGKPRPTSLSFAKAPVQSPTWRATFPSKIPNIIMITVTGYLLICLWNRRFLSHHRGSGGKSDHLESSECTTSISSMICDDFSTSSRRGSDDNQTEGTLKSSDHSSRRGGPLRLFKRKESRLVNIY